MKTPRKALVLAAGFGARLLPLTLSRPKALFPIWETPILRHTLDLLRDWGVRDVLINLHCHAGQIADFLRLNPVPGLRLSFSFEPELLETGGALRRARWWVGDEPFWMLNADVLADLDPRPLIRTFEQYRPPAVLWMHDRRGPRTVELDEDRILNFRSSRAGSPGTCTFCGLQLLSPRILRFLPEQDAFSIVSVYERAMSAGETLRGISVPDAYWADIGSPPAYLAAHRDILDACRRRRPGARFYTGPRPPRARSDEFVSVGCGSRISPKARVKRSVVWEHSAIASGATVQDAIVANHVTVSGRVPYIALRASDMNDRPLPQVLAHFGWAPDRTLALPLHPRGSARTFTRLVHGDRSVLLIQYTPARPENALYAAHARFLRRIGVSAPRLLLDLPTEQACVIEDAGDECLQDRVPAMSQTELIRSYRRTLDTVIRLHERGAKAARRDRLPLSQPFSRHLYEWEQGLFAEQFLRRHTGAGERRIARVLSELHGIIPRLLRSRPVLVHRDLQSSNVLLRHGKPVLIDFQGMRIGPAAYDLASLLCDPYVCLPLAVRESLLDYYEHNAANGHTVRRLFWVAAVERLAQALGAFGRMGASQSTAGFLKHIPAGVRELRHAVRQVGGMPALDGILSEYPDCAR